MGTDLIAYDKITNPLEACEVLGPSYAMICGAAQPYGPAIVMTCLSQGLTPLEFARRYHIIEGKPSMRTDAMLAEARMNYGVKFEVLERTSEAAHIKVTDKNGGVYEDRLTWEDAKKEDFVWVSGKGPGSEDKPENIKKNWRSPRMRRSMLWARVVSDTLRYVVPELVAGVYTPEEVHDFVDEEKTAAPRMVTADEVLSAKVTVYDGEVVNNSPEFDQEQPENSEEIKNASAETSAENLSEEPAESDQKLATESQVQAVVKLMDEMELNEEKRRSIIEKRGVESLAEMTENQIKYLKKRLEESLKN